MSCNIYVYHLSMICFLNSVESRYNFGRVKEYIINYKQPTSTITNLVFGYYTPSTIQCFWIIFETIIVCFCIENLQTTKK